MFVRVIPGQHFVGTPTLPHRPYAFYADAFSLHGRTIAECYRLLSGLGLPPAPFAEKHKSPFVRSDEFGPSAPIGSLMNTSEGSIARTDMSLGALLEESFVVLEADPSQDLDPFPATWRAIAFIVSDRERMGATELSWRIPPDLYPSARVYALFNDLHRQSGLGMLAERQTKDALGLSDFTLLPTRDEEAEYYAYLSHDSGFTDEIVRLFGLQNRCWHGCGYIGRPGFPLCRTFLLRNRMPHNGKVRVAKGYERFEYLP